MKRRDPTKSNNQVTQQKLVIDKVYKNFALIAC